MQTFVPLRDGARLAVQIVGRGRPVMLLHGFGSRASHWLPNVLPLATRYRFILPDLRGFGGSHAAPLPEPDVLATYARDVHDVLDHLHLERVILGGLSMGACTSMKFFGLGGAERVERYLHIDQAPKTRNDTGWSHGVFGPLQSEVFSTFRDLADRAEAHPAGTPYHALPLALRRDMRHAIGTFLSLAFSRRRHQVGIRWLAINAEPLLRRTLFPLEAWRSYLAVMRAYLDEDDDLRPGLRALRAPMTAIVGMRSAMYPPEGQLRIRESTPHVELVRFEKSGHLPMFDEPLLFQRTLTRFLDRPS